MHDAAKHLLEATEAFSRLVSEDVKASETVIAKKDQEAPLHPVNLAVKAGDGPVTVRG